MYALTRASAPWWGPSMIRLSRSGREAKFRRAIAEARSLCVRCGFSAERGDEVSTAVQEALLNAVEHGVRGGRGVWRMTARIDSGAVAVEIEAPGAGPPSAGPIPDLEAQILGRQAVSGWGLYLIRSLASHVTFISKGSRHAVRMRFEAAAPGSPVDPVFVRLDDAP